MFGLFKSKKRKEAERLYQEDLERAENARRLHGVNLDEWRYLGRTVISYVDHGTDDINSSATVFAFCGINDMDDRHFIVKPHSKYSDFSYHTWVLEHANLWEIGERRLWEIIGAEPSQWLCEYMDEQFGEVWSQEAKWWIKKGTQPKKKPKLELVKDDNNVVKLDFAKKPKKEET